MYHPMRSLAAFCLIVLSGLVAVAPANSAEPGRGLTAEIETEYLKFIIDHHFSALRMTELAAGTDFKRDALISPEEGTSPSPSAPETKAKASLDELKSLARRNNRGQREEIMTAQGFLRDWYGINYEPRIRKTNQQQIDFLERAKAGRDFDHFFLEVFSRHHFQAMPRTLECLAGRDIKHHELRRYCTGILQSQLSDIDEMRDLLCEKFVVCDYLPLSGLKGRHSGGEDSQNAGDHNHHHDDD